jgi:Domain of unknown function (DUF5753)
MSHFTPTPGERNPDGPAAGQPTDRREPGQAGTTVTVQVLPFSVGEYPGLGGSFSLLSLGTAAPTIGHMDTLGVGSAYVERESVASLVERFDRLRATALGPEESRAFILDWTGSDSRGEGAMSTPDVPATNWFTSSFSQGEDIHCVEVNLAPTSSTSATACIPLTP